MVRKKQKTNERKLKAIVLFFIIAGLTIISVELYIQNLRPQVMLSAEEGGGKCSKLEVDYYDSMNIKTETIYDDNCLIITRIEYYDKTYNFDGKTMPWPKEVSVYEKDGSIKITRYDSDNMKIIG